MKLDQRTYVCPECGMTMDRDVNAAINIRNFTLRNVIKNLNTEGTSGINACGVGSSGNCDVNCNCETIDIEARKSRCKS